MLVAPNVFVVNPVTMLLVPVRAKLAPFATSNVAPLLPTIAKPKFNRVPFWIRTSPVTFVGEIAATSSAIAPLVPLTSRLL